MDTLGVSIIVCCYNSALRIRDTLEYIGKQEVEKDTAWEVIVVNNASTDDTLEVVNNFVHAHQTDLKLRIVQQPVPGLSFARQKGIEASQYEFLIFCDDDNWLYPDYVQKMYELFCAHTEVGAIGGYGIAVYETPPQEWVLDFERHFAIGGQGSASGDVTDKKGCLYGAGMGLRKSVYRQLLNVGFKSGLTGRKGKELSSGEDTELTYAMRLLGYRLWYDEHLRFKHYITASRTTKEYVKKLRKEMAKSAATLAPYRDVLRGTSAGRMRRFYRTLKFILTHPHRTLFGLFSPSMQSRESSKFYLRTRFIELISHRDYERKIREINKWRRS